MPHELPSLEFRSQLEDEWLRKLLSEGIEREQDDWRRSLLRASALVIDGSHSIEDMTPDLCVALSARGLTEPDDQVRESALAEVLKLDDPDGMRAVVQRAALEWLLTDVSSINLSQPTVSHLVHLLEGVPAALKRWSWEDAPKTRGSHVTAQKWDIQHEYHVQALLWTILRPVFRRLEDEEYLRSLGHKHPRADLAVPGLRVIVEVKFLRSATQRARSKVIEEVSADVGLYLSGDSPYDSIVAFVWDDSTSLHHHDELRDGLVGLDGVSAAVVVGRPGEWERQIDSEDDD